MKTIRFAATLAVLAATTTARAQSPDEAKSVYAEIKSALGLVPTFLRAFPPEAIGAVWDEYKGTELNPTSAIPGRYKELIGLGVAAQIPCRYCVYFHTSAARLAGASEREIREALALAGIVRKWSTVLNGMQIDEAKFRLEMGRVFEYVKKPHAQVAATPVTDAASAYKDVEATLGLVPSFVRAFPEAGVAGAWREMKTLQLSPASAIPNKYKDLIGLAIAAQIPCRYCTYFHTEAAKLAGATQTEVAEAVAMAGITRHWSTFLNGLSQDEAAFRKEVDQIIAHLKKQTKTTAAR